MTTPILETTRDAFLGGRVIVHQPKTGFRGGTDSVLLAAAINSEQCGQALEFGCGSGAALLPAAWRAPNLSFTGMDKDQDALQRAVRGVEENRLMDRVRCLCEDAAALPSGFAGQFDLVFSNPPFFEARRTEPPGPGKHDAYLESISLEAWIRAMLFCLRPKGTFFILHRAAELARILAVLEPLSGEIAVAPIRSYPGGDAKRVIVRARKGLRRGPMRLLSGVDLYTQKGGDRSKTMAAIAGEGVGLDWSQD